MTDAGVNDKTPLEALLYKVIEVLSVVIMFAEIVLLFTSAVARYVFNRPLVWSDELASMLLIWMVMLGAALASWRNEHLRLTIAVRKLPFQWQERVHIFVTAILVVFIAAVIYPVANYVSSEWTIRTPILDIPFSWRFAGIPLGLALIFLVSILGLVRQLNVQAIFISLLIISATVFLMWRAIPIFTEIGNYSLVVYFVILLSILIGIGTPLAFAFAISTFTYLAFATDVPLIVVANRFGEGMSNPILSAIPLFIYLGSLMVMSGLARTLVEFLLALVGRFRGGVSFVVITGMYLVSGISGAKAADMAAIAPVLLPEMERRGSDRADLVALMAATGAMSETIPPSLVLIATGVITGVSMRALFTAGFLPAAVCAVCLALVVIVRSRKEPRIDAPPMRLGQFAKIFVAAIPGLLLPILIRTFVVKGITTATEISAFAIAYTLVLGVMYRSLELRHLYTAAVSAVSLTGSIILIIGFVTAMSWALTQSGFSEDLGALILNLPGGNVGFMLATIAILIILGSILEGLPAVVLVGPILFPIAEEVGINPVHYAIVCILAMGIGLFMPPFGIGFYYSAAIGGVNPDLIMSRIWVYLLFVLLGTLLIAFVPWLSVGFL